MTPVSRRPGTRSNPSSTQEDNWEEFPLLQLDGNDNQERHVLTQDAFCRVNVSFSVNDNECRPQLDNPSNLLPDDDDDYALKECMASQEEANRHEQEEFKNQLESEFQLSCEAAHSSEDEDEDEDEEPNGNNNITYTQGTFEAASVLAGGFFASVDAEADNNITSEVNNSNVHNTGGRPCPGMIGRDENGSQVIDNSASTVASTSNAVSTPDNDAAPTPKRNIAAELANQMRAHGFAGLSEEDKQHVENSKDEGKNAKKHINTQESLEKRFMDALAAYGGIELLKSLGTEMMPNPNDMSEQSPIDYKFYAVVGGAKSADKHKIMNDCLVLCAMKWTNKSGKNKGKQHEPSTFAKYMDNLSYVFKEKGVQYSYSVDFNKKGQFHGILKKKWAEARKENPKFGTAPNKARVEQALFRKFVNAIRNKDITPYTNPEHLCICVIFILGFYCGLRGSEEHIDLSIDDICALAGECQDEDGEDLVGLKWAGVQVPFSKIGQLNLKNTKVKEQNDIILTFVEDPVHDCWDPFQVFCFYLDKCHPKAKKFYARIIKPGGDEAQRLAKAFGKDIWCAESGPGRTNWNMGPTKHRSLCTDIAKLSGVDDYNKCTGHALRALCITHCIGAGLSAADVAAKVRHAAINSSKTHAQECNKRKANRMACVNPNQKLATKSDSKKSPEVNVKIEKQVGKRPKVSQTQPMLPENRQRFEDLVGDVSVRTPSSTVPSVASLPVENNFKENESPDSEYKRLKKQNEILKLKAENARLQQEIANSNVMQPHPQHRQSYPPLTHHRGYKNFNNNYRSGGYRHSYPPPPQRNSRPLSPRFDRRRFPEYPQDHGRYYESDYPDYSDYHHGHY